jgi:sialate O-acetylesterase
MNKRDYLGDVWQKFRGYYIPKEELNLNGWNTIAVRVYDGYLGGGIYQGPVGIASQKNYSDYWKQKRGKKKIFDWLFDQ